MLKINKIIPSTGAHRPHPVTTGHDKKPAGQNILEDQGENKPRPDKSKIKRIDERV